MTDISMTRSTPRTEAAFNAERYASRNRPLIEGRLVTFYLPDIYAHHLVVAALVVALGGFAAVQATRPADRSSELAFQALAQARLELLPVATKTLVNMESSLGELTELVSGLNGKIDDAAKRDVAQIKVEEVDSLVNSQGVLVAQLGVMSQQLHQLDAQEQAIRAKYGLAEPLWETQQADLLANAHFRHELLLGKLSDASTSLANLRRDQQEAEAKAVLVAAAPPASVAAPPRRPQVTRSAPDSDRREASFRRNKKPNWRSERW
jgi:hypothetical protein